jgi:hypothetical protein
MDDMEWMLVFIFIGLPAVLLFMLAMEAEVPK